MSSRLLVQRTAPDIERLLGDGSVLVIPIGSIEQHRAHLPIATDLLIAEAIAVAATELAADDGIDVWLLPAIAYTKSDEHHWAPGTIWLSWETLMNTIIDIGRSLATTQARRLVFLNGHGGNSALIEVACRELRRRFGLHTFAMRAYSPAVRFRELSQRAEFGLGIHGGLLETSMMLHLHPDLVHMDLAVRHVPEHLDDYQHVGFGKRASFGWLSSDFDPAGVIGDPTAAAAQIGAELFADAVAEVASAFAEISTFQPASQSLSTAKTGTP